MRMLRRWRPVAAALLALGIPAGAPAELDGSASHASSIARFASDSSEPTITSFPDHLDVELFTTASESYTPAFGPWLDSR